MTRPLIRAGAVLSTIGALVAAIVLAPAPALADTGVRIVPASPIGEAAVHEVTLVLVAPQGVAPDFSLADAVRSVEQVDAYYDRETNGFIRFEIASSLDWSTPDEPIACSDFGAVNAYSERVSGFERGENRHLLTLVPGRPECGGTAYGGQGADVNSGELVFQPGINPTTIAHELGHNMSLAHANAVRCTDGWDFDNTAPRPSSCERVEYGDRYDNMGNGYSFWPASAGTLDRLGLIDNEVVPVCGAPRTVTLNTMSAPVDAQRILSWSDPTAPRVQYWVQYRDRADNDLYRDVYREPGLDPAIHASGVVVSKADAELALLSGAVLERPGDASDRNQLLRAGERLELSGGAVLTIDRLDEQARTATVTVDVPCPATAPGGDLAQQAVASASATSPWTTVGAVNDGITAAPGWGSWPAVGETWVQLTWPQAVELDRIDAWFDADAADEDRRGLIPPRAWQVQAQLANGAWQPVQATAEASRDRDGFNTLRFAPTSSRAFRVVMQAWGDAEGEGSSAVRELRAFAPEPVTPTEPPVVPGDPTPPAQPGDPAQPSPDTTPATAPAAAPDRATDEPAPRTALARTGAPIGPWAASGAVLMLLGIVVAASGRRGARRL